MIQLNEAIIACFDELNKITRIDVKIDINIDRDRPKIYDLYIKGVKEGSLAVKFPEIAKEWHEYENLRVKPNMVSPFSNKIVVWKCEKGHIWKASINNRVAKGSNCPICANKRVLKGFNDLATTHPTLANQWNCNVNKDISPNDVVAGSGKRVAWKCECEHEWLATIHSRVKGNGCPLCGVKKRSEAIASTLINKKGSLADNFPDLAKEWHPYKNNGLTPDEVIGGKKEKVWWQCKNHGNHEWEGLISERIKGAKCPICANRKVLVGYNDLSTTNSMLAKEWHPTKNDGLKPTEVVAGAGKRVWWICENEHEWEATVVKRNMGRGCPECRKIKKDSK